MPLFHPGSSFRRLFISAILVCLPANALADNSCGKPERPCEVAGGIYFADVPDSPVGAPVVIWLHGYGRSGEQIVSNENFLNSFRARGFVVIAPDGQVSAAPKRDWGVVDGLDWARDDLTFLNTVRADAVDRFGLDEDRVLVAGFSRGGSMAWDLACRTPEIGRAYAAVAGAFWEPMAEDCVAPVDLYHTHGFADRLVPLEGREVVFDGDAMVQGSVMKGVDVWRREMGCMGSAKAEIRDEGIWEKSWDKCADGSITLELTPEGHGVPDGWVERVLDWFERLEAGK